MILAALLAAGALEAASPPGPKQAEPMPNLYSEPAWCPSVVQKEAARQKVALKGLVPLAQYAVQRQLDGCSVPTPVGYHPSYIERGAAAAPPVTREDAPSNRR